jgi:hypothetical protein
VTKASLYHLAVVACLVVIPLLLATIRFLPDNMFDGAD